MSRRCQICGKGQVTGNTVSHADNASRRTWLPNLHRVRAIVGGRVKRIKVCTRCLRSDRVKKAFRGGSTPAESVA